MRNVFVLLLGIVIGALAAANIVSVLRQRDAYPRGLMNVMQHHYAALRQQADTQQCDGRAALHLAVMRLVSNQIETAIYGNKPPDPEFHTDAVRLRDALDHAGIAANASKPCVALVPAMHRVGEACDICHRSYR